MRIQIYYECNDCGYLPEACPHLQAPLGHLQFSGPQPHDVPPQVEHAKEKWVKKWIQLLYLWW